MFDRTLSIFRKFRALAFTVCVILSAGCTTIFAIYLNRESNSFDLISRIIVIALTAIHALGVVCFYLMIFVRLNIWLDFVRVYIYLALVSGGAVMFIIGRARLPCSNSGIGNVCSQLTLSVVIASFVISGLLLLYSIVLGVIVYLIPRPLLAKAPSDLLGEGLSTVDSRTNLIPSADRSRTQASSSNDRPYPQRPTQGLARQHAPEPLNLSEGAALSPAFSYTVTASPAPRSSVSTPMSSEMRYNTPLISHPYGTAELALESPTTAWNSRRGPPSSSSPSATSHDSSRNPYRKPHLSTRSTPAESSSRATHADHPSPSLTRSGTAQSVPPYLAVPSQTLPSRPSIPNPFMEPISRSTTPSTPGTISGDRTRVPPQPSNVSLSFGSRGFPLPPAYNWSDSSTSSASSSASQSPPSTPLSLIPGVPSMKQSGWPSPVTESPRPLSFGSIAASFHSKMIPTPPAPAARLAPHPRLQTYLESTPSPRASPRTPVKQLPSSPLRVANGTPTSAKTFRSQFLPTDIDDWPASEHENRI